MTCTKTYVFERRFSTLINVKIKYYGSQFNIKYSISNVVTKSVNFDVLKITQHNLTKTDQD